MELPPRARRIQWRRASRRSRPGTTSACAENTADDEQLRPMGRNYLRVRGEYPRNYDMCHIVKELPPRARRILTPRGDSIQLTGTTSACAENTLTDHRGVTHVGNYLRVRGEYPISRTKYDSSSELPPRARRILSPFLSESPHEGTTSACAENTRLSTALTTPRWNYLRVRGEYLVSPPLVGNHDELPPRARRIRPLTPIRMCLTGTTSACAENTNHQNY